MVRVLTTILFLSAGALTAQVRFVPNEGQWPDHVLHRAEAIGGSVQLERTGWTCWQWAPETDAAEDHHVGARKGILWQAEWIDANPDHALLGPSGLASDRQHFYLSDDPAHWAEHVQAATMLRTEDLWPGVRLALARDPTRTDRLRIHRGTRGRPRRHRLAAPRRRPPHRATR